MTADMKVGMARFEKKIGEYFRLANSKKIHPDMRHLYMRDFADLRHIYELIELGTFAEAWSRSAKLDTAVREEIPNVIWEYMKELHQSSKTPGRL
jgi:hypothetical protein